MKDKKNTNVIIVENPSLHQTIWRYTSREFMKILKYRAYLPRSSTFLPGRKQIDISLEVTKIGYPERVGTFIEAWDILQEVFFI